MHQLVRQRRGKLFKNSFFIVIVWILSQSLCIASPGDKQNQSQRGRRRARIEIQPSFDRDPIQLMGKTGGAIAANEIAAIEETATGPCVGYFNRQPNHIFTLSNFFDFLKVEVESPNDTTMVIRGPGGIWCSDDANNKNPAIAGQWQAGTYSIWVGSYEPDTSFPYKITITKQE